MTQASPLAAQSVAEFLAAVAAKQPTPGGGAVAAVTGALGAALAQMVVNYSLGKKNLTEHQPALQSALSRLERARAMLLELAAEDAAAYGLVSTLRALPERDPRRSELPGAEAAAIAVPQAMAALSLEVLRLLGGLAGASNRHLRSDLAIAAVLAEAAVRASGWNVWINLQSGPAAGTDAAQHAAALAAVTHQSDAARQLASRVEAACAMEARGP